MVQPQSEKIAETRSHSLPPKYEDESHSTIPVWDRVEHMSSCQRVSAMCQAVTSLVRPSVARAALFRHRFDPAEPVSVRIVPLQYQTKCCLGPSTACMYHRPEL
jgi:hypothetical protein